MGKVKLFLGLVFAGAVAAFLSFYLPNRDIVRVVGTEVARVGVDATNRDGQLITHSRDVRYIKTTDDRGRPRVFRNEDTGFGWPPYFKFDAADLAAEAEAAVSPESNPRWMIVTSYGWRINMLSAFPNAVWMRPAEGPDQTLIPWFNIAVLVVLAAAALAIRRRLLRLFGADRPRSNPSPS
jgi:hypothetical protein